MDHLQFFVKLLVALALGIAIGLVLAYSVEDIVQWVSINWRTLVG